MRTVLAWQETPPEKDGIRNVCYSLCFSPDGSQLVAGVGSRVLVYDAADGDLLHALKGHKDAVYAVAYAANGKRFASGGADKTVVIWTSKAEGILKYTHHDSVQCLAYNPVSQQLASGTAADIGLWSPEQKSVAKHKVPSRVLSVAWSADGMHLALGCFDGSISIRDKAGAEQVKVAMSTSPVWTVTWCPQDQAVLAAGSLDGWLRFYTSTGAPKHKEREFEGGILSLAYFNNDFLLVSTTDKQVQLATKEGILLNPVSTRTNWAWAVAARARNNFLACGGEDGSITVQQIAFSTVHGLYHERYAYRDMITDVIIQHLLTEQKVRIKCRDYVKKIAVYRERVAVQLPNKVVLYEVAPGGDELDMQYKSGGKIHQKLECNLLVVTSAHLTLCQERTLQLYNFEGVKEREWVLDAVIRYIKVLGGPPRREGLVVGLKSGAVLKVYVDNPFPIPLIQHTCSVRCLDMSASRNKLALVDETSSVVVYDLTTKEMLFEEKGANSVAWNEDFEDMLCFTGNGLLAIKTADFPVTTQRLQGFVVGFKGSKVFCLQYVSMQTIDVPQSQSMHRYLDRGDHTAAYKVACLGVTDADWRALGMAALQAFNIDIARQAFVRLRDVSALDLVDRVEAGLGGHTPRPLLAAEAAAWRGDYQEAARLMVQEGAVDKALEMFTSLRMFDEAKAWAEEAARLGKAGAGGAGGEGGAGGGLGAGRVADLMGRQAAWNEETANYEAAVEMYIKAKKYDRALSLLIRNAWWERLTALLRSLDKTADASHLRAAAAALRKAGQYGAAKEALLRLEDVPGLLALAVEEEKWEDAFLLLHMHPEHKPAVYGPYAIWLCARDRFQEARSAYQAAGQHAAARALLAQLAEVAVAQQRWEDAAYAHYQLALEALQDITHPPAAFTPEDTAALASFSDLYDTAEMYAAYAPLAASRSLPYKTLDDSSLFGAACWLFGRCLGREPPPGVSLVTVALAVAEGARAAGAHKLARFAYSKLQTMVVPPALVDAVDLAAVVVRASPFQDAEQLAPVCYRCQAVNPLVHPQGASCCVSCGAQVLVSPLTWEQLPLVAFELEAGISEAEATALLGEDTGVGDEAGARGLHQNMGDGANVLTLEEEYMPSAGAGGAGGPHLEAAFGNQVPGAPIVLGRAALRQLRPAQVLVRRWAGCPHLPGQWFRVMDPDAALVAGPCGHFYEADEFDMYVLEHGHAPFSRVPAAQLTDSFMRAPAAESSSGSSSGGAADDPGQVGGSLASSLRRAGPAAAVPGPAAAAVGGGGGFSKAQWPAIGS